MVSISDSNIVHVLHVPYVISNGFVVVVAKLE